jgi:putative oxidoreductase
MANKVETGLLVVRLVTGVIFLYYGIDKFQMGLGNVAQMFESVGIPGFMAYIVAIMETVGGIAMIAGIGVRIVSVLFGLIMIGAFTVNFSEGFTGYDYNLILLAVSVLLVLSGSRMYALDQLMQRSSNAARTDSGANEGTTT